MWAWANIPHMNCPVTVKRARGFFCGLRFMKRRNALRMSCPTMIVAMVTLGLGSVLAGHTNAAEPNLELASQWWPELPNKWTTVGWRDHLYRFNVLFNGSLMNFPARQNRAGSNEPGAQFTFY